MSECAYDDMHDWQFMFTLGNTRTLIQAVFGCHCGVAKKVDMRWEFEQLTKSNPAHPDHPDNRFTEQRALELAETERVIENGDEEA